MTDLFRPEEGDKLQGVGGWLLVFAAGAAAISPAVTIINVILLVTSYREIALRSLEPYAILETLLSVTLTVFGVYAGAALITRTDPSAVKIAKMYLLAAVVGRALVLLLYYFLVEGWQRKFMTSSPWLTLVATMVGAYIWYSYFNKSRRVRTTYYSDE